MELRARIGARRVLEDLKPLIIAEVSEAALSRQGGSVTAPFDLLESAGYVSLVFDPDTGLPVPWHSNGGPRSDNIVAVHRARDFGLLAGGA